MDFTTNKPIYQQIVDYCFRQIIQHIWKEEERILSVRELGALLEVNPNTVMRSYDYMQTEEIIYLKRGMGYYVNAGATAKIVELQRKEFFENVLPETFRTMELLDIHINEVVTKYKQLKKK